MAEITVQKHFDAPPEHVWALLADLGNAADRIDAITKVEVLSDGPVGVGTRFRETRIVFKKEHTEEMEITEFDPPRQYTTEARSAGTLYRCRIACEPDGGGAMVSMSFETIPQTFAAKLMAPLFKLMMGSCRKAFEKDLEDLKRAAKSHAAAPTSPTTQPA